MRTFVLFMCTMLLFVACQTGKRALENGKYDEAVTQATECLVQFPNYKTPMRVLQTAYPLAFQRHSDNISQYETIEDVLKWEMMAHEYQLLLDLRNRLQNCRSFRDSIVITGFNFEHYQKVLNNACEYRYLQGLSLLMQSNVDSVQQAYLDFKKIASINPTYKDNAIQLELATIKLNQLRPHYSSASSDLIYMPHHRYHHHGRRSFNYHAGGRGRRHR